jgi:hypothetical protein
VAAQGKCLAVLKANAAGGPITFKASVQGLPVATLSIATKAENKQ